MYTYVLNNPLIYVDPTGNWSTEVTANWTINEYKLAYEKAKASGGNYQKYADAANALRAQLVATGRYSSSDIMQSTDSAIPEKVVLQIANSSVEEWAKSDPAGFGLYFKGVTLSVPTSKTEVALSFAGGMLGKIGGLEFRSQKLLDDHFDKHVIKQKELGPITKAAYLKGAQNLYSEIADGTNILTMSRTSDKATLIYKPSTNEFLSISSDGYIKTYFKPTNGMQYWESQK